MTKPQYLIGLGFYFICAVGLNLKAATIEDAASKADLIVIGSVGSWTETASKVSFDIRVERVVKGKNVPASLHVGHIWTHPIAVLGVSSDTSVTDQQLDGMWFLGKNDDSSWNALSVRGIDGLVPDLCLPASLSSAGHYQYSSSAEVRDKVVAEFAAGLLADNAHPEIFFHMLGSLSSPTVDQVLSDFLQSSNDSFRDVAVASLLATSKPLGIRKLSLLWPSISQGQARAFVVSALRDSFRDTRRSSVLELTDIAEKEKASVDLRAAAIRAIRATHTKESLPFLASLLSSPDAEERMNGVIGLSSFANGCPPQTPQNIKSMEYIQFKNPSPYQTPETIAAFAFGPVNSARESELVAFWEDWWNQHKAEIGF